MGDTFWLYFIIKSYISLVLISLKGIVGVKVFSLLHGLLPVRKAITPASVLVFEQKDDGRVWRGREQVSH